MNRKERKLRKIIREEVINELTKYQIFNMTSWNDLPRELRKFLSKKGIEERDVEELSTTGGFVQLEVPSDKISQDQHQEFYSLDKDYSGFNYYPYYRSDIDLFQIKAGFIHKL